MGLKAILASVRDMFLRGDDFFMAKPKQKALPGMEDREIKELREAALEYADARDERVSAAETEAGLRDNLLKLMKKHKKVTYPLPRHSARSRSGREGQSHHREEGLKRRKPCTGYCFSG